VDKAVEMSGIERDKPANLDNLENPENREKFLPSKKQKAGHSFEPPASL